MSQVLQEVLHANQDYAASFGDTGNLPLSSSNLYRRSIDALIKPVYFLRALVLRFFWHTRAYGTIAAIMVLALFSIVFLWLYETGHKLLGRHSAEAPCYPELNASDQQ